MCSLFNKINTFYNFLTVTFIESFLCVQPKPEANKSAAECTTAAICSRSNNSEANPDRIMQAGGGETQRREQYVIIKCKYITLL